MTPEEIVQRLADERRVGSRFPVRVVFVEDTSQYLELVKGLRGVCDETLEMAEFCSARDVFPNFRKLFDRIEALKDKHILLLSLGEYLRLSIIRELRTDRGNISSLWYMQQSASSKTRVIVPLLFCRDLWDRVIPYDDERQRDCVWELISSAENKGDSQTYLSGSFSLNIYSQEFSEALSDTDLLHGVQTWLSKWPEMMIGSQKQSCRLVTSLWRNTEQMSSFVNVRVISDVFNYVVASLKDGNILKREWGDDEDWVSLSKNLHHSTILVEVIKKSLNVYSFEPVALLSRWKIISDFKRWLVWLWYRFNRSEDYCGYAIKRASTPDEIVDSIVYSIFDCVEKSEWIEERAKAIIALKIDVNTEDLLAKLEEIPSVETRFAVLSCESHKEKAYAIKNINRYLNKGIDFEVVVAPLREKFPLLWEYMAVTDKSLPPELAAYLHWYRKHKLMNVLPPDAAEVVKKINLECFESRYSELKQFETLDAFFLWVDAMGAEWLPLLLACLRKKTIEGFVEAKVVCGRVPTETSFNQQWKEMNAPYQKLDALDKLAHSGTPDDNDYFSCIVHQLEQIEKVAEMAANRLNEHDYVLITADHGTSRLAALAFHKLPGFTPPHESVVKSHGRYCELQKHPLPKDIIPEISHVEHDEKHFLVFKNHEHYTQPGNAAGRSDADFVSAGELHGGATPEEMIVPIVVLKRSIPLPPKPNISTPSVFREKGSVTINISFSKKIRSLSAYSGEAQGTCSDLGTGQEWNILFKAMNPGEHVLRLEADGKMLEDNCHFIVKTKGIAEDDMFGE